MFIYLFLLLFIVFDVAPGVPALGGAAPWGAPGTAGTPSGKGEIKGIPQLLNK